MISLTSEAPRAHVAMFSATVILIACAVTTAIGDQNLNVTDLMNNTTLIQKLLENITAIPTFPTNKVTNQALNVSVSDKTTKPTISAAKINVDNVTSDTERYDPYGNEARHIEESPDYASSVVLASDLLSLSSAVSSVQETACRDMGYKFLDGLIANKRWALKMFDASAKSPQGLLFGSSYHLGNFDECVATSIPGENEDIGQGQYCLATIMWKPKYPTKNTRTGRGETLRWAMCVPNACQAKSVAKFVSNVLLHSVVNTTEVEVTERDCYTRQPLTISLLDAVFVGIIASFISILILSTSYEAYIIYTHNTNKYLMTQIILSFSLISNMKKILSTKQNNALGLECVAGMKTLAMVFIIAGHACMFIASGPVMDAEAWDRLVRSPANAFMLNNTLLVDTFLMLSAFLFTRLLLAELDKRDGRLNVLPILIFRYIRVTPAYFIVIFFYMTWLPKIGEGPLWRDRLLLEQERCYNNWWTNILYINNYVNSDQMCMFQSWYLSVDTQLFFVAPIFIYSLWKWRVTGRILVLAMLTISAVVPSLITFIYKLDPTLLFYAKEFTDIISNRYFHEAYIKTHMKMQVYFMGIITGYILHSLQCKNYEFSRNMKIIGWTASIIIGTLTTFSVTVFYQEWYQYSRLGAAFYISLHKLAWCAANGWLIIACATENGGILGKLLTWRFLVPFSRLTFCAYLVNGIVELYYVGELRHPLHITFFTVVANGISHVLLTFVLALILCLTFESPLHGIEKILLRFFARPVLSDNASRNDTKLPS